MSWIVRMVMICFILAEPGWLPYAQAAWAQPVLSTKRTIADVDIYQDHEFPTRYYYSPPEVKLQMASSGSPAFILLQMRYTGTLLYGDQAQRGFQNILQLSVALQTMPNETFDMIKKSLGVNTDLRPLPITRFIGELIIPLGDAAAA
ncbi:MAG TPA: hypothetical protein VJ508_15035, partial [Saprospiraceae bacterium]|nr:hypothetical protein [Saprospiraceae bacterium]